MLMQTRFSGQSEYIIKKQYAISADEKIICGIWIHLRRKGFVFTDKGFYWNLPTSIINAAGKQEVTVPSNILTENSGRLKVAILHKENQSHTNHSVEFLQFSTDMGRVQIKLEPITTDDASILRRIFIEYAARGKFPYDNLKQSPLESFSMVANGLLDFFQAPLKGYKKEKVEKEEPEDPMDKPQMISVGRSHSVSDVKSYFSARVRRQITPKAVFKNVMRYVGDIIADILFFAGLIISVKPILLFQNTFKPHNIISDFFYKIGSLLFCFDTTSSIKLGDIELQHTIVESILYRRNSLFALLFILYILIRLSVILISCKPGGKKFPIVLLIATIPLTLLIPNHFTIFVILCFIIYVLIQIGLDMDWIHLFTKIIVSGICLCMVFYFLHLFNYPNFIEYMGVLVQMLSLKSGL